MKPKKLEDDDVLIQCSDQAMLWIIFSLCGQNVHSVQHAVLGKMQTKNIFDILTEEERSTFISILHDFNGLFPKFKHLDHTILIDI